MTRRTLQLTVQAPVSSVQLVFECLSQGETKVSCSSEGGDSPQYSWTLNGQTLTDAELLTGNTDTNIITLKQNVSGRLVCLVRRTYLPVASYLLTAYPTGHAHQCGSIKTTPSVVNQHQSPLWTRRVSQL